MAGTGFFVCPECKNGISFEGIKESRSCAACGHPAAFKNGVVSLLPKTLQTNKLMEDQKWSTDTVENRNKPAWLLILEHRNTINFLIDKLIPAHDFSGTVLEVGAGTCWASSIIKSYFKSSVCVAADVSANALEKGIEVNGLIGDKIDYFINCDIEKLPFRDDSFDVIFGSAVLHHFYDPEKGMAEIYRVLKKGGKYIGTYEMALNSLIKFFWSRFGTPGMVSKQLGVRENVYTFTEWAALFSKAGFKNVEMPLERDWQYMKPHWLNLAYYKFMSYFPDPVVKLIGSGVGFVAKK